MRVTKLAAATIAALMLGTAAVPAAVNVTFVNPERFPDDDFRSAVKRRGVIAEFTRYFEQLDERYLKDGQKLDIEVLNARLAGQYEPLRPTYEDVRILRDTTPPRFRIRYTLREGGKVVASGEETVSDMNYLWNPAARNSIERFPYEKDMLRGWFVKRFVGAGAPRG